MNKATFTPNRIRFIALILVGLFFEIFVFNIRHFELPLFGNQQVDFTFTSEIVSLSADNVKHDIQITINDPEKIPAELRSLEIQFENPPQEILAGSVHTTEDGSYAGHTRNIKIIPGVPHSYSVYLYPGYPVTSILIQLDHFSPQAVTISLNKRLPIVFNWLRFCVILLVISIIYLLRPGSPAYQRRLNLSEGWQKLVLAVLLLAQIAFLVFTALSTYPDLADAFQKGNLREEDYFFKGHYQLLTEALFQKSLSVLRTPPEALALAKNPYDPDQRISQFPDYEWDMSYFNGKYYVYFGVVPALTFYMPYTLLFRRYPLNDIAVLFFAVLAILGLTACFTILIQKFFPKIPAALYFAGLFMLINSAMLAWIVRRPFSYELALASSLAFSTCGLAFCLSAQRAQRADSQVVPWRSALGCLLLACAVGCRPTGLLASFLILPVTLPALVQSIKTRAWGRLPGLLLPVIIPYAVIGGGLMAYNYARFGSALEFGRTWQLSVQDSAAYANGLSISAFLIGNLNTVLGNFSQLTDTFPFLKPGAVLRFNFEGIKEFHTVFPVSAFFPLLYSLFLIPAYWKRIKEKGPFFLSMLLLLILIPIFLSGATGLMVGVIQRYTTDFSWMLALAGLFMVFLMEEKSQNKTVKKIIHLIVLLCLFINLAHTIALSCGDTWEGKSWFEFMNPILFHKIAYAFSFWL